MRRMWLAAFVFMLLLAACAHPRPLGEGRSEGGSASLPTATPLPPTATRPPATPTPTPTPGPEALKGGIYPYLDHYLGRPEATFVSDKTLWGTTRLSPPDNNLFAAYGIIDDGASKYVLVSNGINADLVPADKVPQDVLSSLHKLDLTTDEAKEKIRKAIEWKIYEEKFTFPEDFSMLVRTPDGRLDRIQVNLKRFIEDEDYGKSVLREIYGKYDVTIENVEASGWHEEYIRNPNRSEPSHIDDLYRGMVLLYKYTNFTPDNSWIDGAFETEYVYSSSVKGSRVSMIGRLNFEMPSIDVFKNGRKWTHTNIDILKRDSDGYKRIAVYNPFTPDVKPRVVRASFWQSTDRSTLYASLLVRVTDPNTGKSLYFEFEHLTAAHRQNGRWAPENELWERVLMRGSRRFVDVSIPLEQGQLLGYVSDPKTDVWSNAYHVQFGQVFNKYRWIKQDRGVTVYNPYTAALQVYFMTHQADKYRPAWDEEPQGSGFWIGNKHVVFYRPSVPAVPVRDVNTLPYVPIKLGKKKPGWKDQLPDSAMFSKHPKGFYRRRA